MNIFVLDRNPMLAAQAHYDTHVVKMCLESVQILSSAVILSGDKAPYKLTHANHPCVRWVLEEQTHYDWLCRLAGELGCEYTVRYGRIHKSILALQELPGPKTDRTPEHFALAMPDEFKTDDPVESYRNYYRVGKRDLASYRAPATRPDWLN